jgi:hypothetical protein
LCDDGGLGRRSVYSPPAVGFLKCGAVPLLRRG